MVLIENRENHERTVEIAQRQKLNALLLYTETGDGSCPLACGYCFLAKQGEIKTMSLETLHRSIDFLMEYGKYQPQDENARRLHFFGTEPLKRWELVVAAAEHAPDLKITLTTNGYLMTEEKIQWLKDHPNVRVVIWSLDGDEHHNRHRVTRAGKSSHAQIVKNLRRYAEVIGLEEVALRGTITTEDMDLVSRFAFLQDLNPGSVEIVPDVTADWDESEVAAMYRRLGEHYGWQRPPSNLLANILHAVQQPKPRRPGNQCGTGYFAWSVSPDGALSLCQGWEEYPHMRFGSVWDGVTTTLPFELVSWEVDKFRQEGNPYPKPGCKDCHAYNHCMGIGWCATEFYRSRRDPERPWEDPIDMVATPTDGYCAHLRGAVTAMEYWAAQQNKETHEANLLELLMEEGNGWVTIDSESSGNRTLANS